jgi:hypothetical protein
MASNPQAQYGESAVGIVEGDPLNDARESFALLRLLAVTWPVRRQELGRGGEE